MKAMIAAAVLLVASPAFAHQANTANTPAATKSKPKPATAPNTTHSGGTDAQGCHTNHATGDYHCHTPK
jgi:methionine-rich copper-binding protein CopC